MGVRRAGACKDPKVGSEMKQIAFTPNRIVYSFAAFAGLGLLLLLLLPGSVPITRAFTTSDPVIAAAGDIACGANTGSKPCQYQATSDLIANLNPDAVLPLGDEQYECGELSNFNGYYDPTWGRFKSVTFPAVGNHEYSTSTSASDPCFNAPPGAPGYYTYFGPAASPLDSNCSVNCKGYYSWNLGAWHLIALNGNCSEVGGCGAGSPQEKWLKADLAANTSSCTLAYWHQPRFSSNGNLSAYDAFWQDLYAAHADIVLNGHHHNYQRFALQNPSEQADPNGIREFVVGTGGYSHGGGFKSTAPNTEVNNAGTFGILKLVLHPGSYDWQFIPVPGASFTDSGTTTCHGSSAPAPTNTPTPTLVATPTPTPTSVSGGTNLLSNPGFELDADNNGSPDNWTIQSQFTRSSAVVHGGSFAGQHSATTNANYGVSQVVKNLTAGATYNFSGWVNIPPTADDFTFSLQVRWRDSSNTVLRTDTVKSYTAATSGWDQAAAALVAPAGTTNAQIKMLVRSLNATIYVDDFSFGP